MRFRAPGKRENGHDAAQRYRESPHASWDVPAVIAVVCESGFLGRRVILAGANFQVSGWCVNTSGLNHHSM